MKNLLIILSLIPLIGCKSQPNLHVYDVDLLRKYTLPLLEDQPSATKNLFLENNSVLFVADRRNHRIVAYNLSKKSINSVYHIPIKPHDDQFDFIVTGDSIIIFFDPAKTVSYDHDSCVFVFNKQFDTLAIHGIKYAHSRIIGNEGARESGNWLYSSRLYMPSLYGLNKLFYTLQSTSSHKGSKQFLSDELPVGGHIEISTGKAVIHRIVYPGEEGVYYPEESINPFQCISDERRLVIYGFRHTNNLYTHNLKTGEVQTIIISDGRLSTSDMHKYRYDQQIQISEDPYVDRPWHLLYDQYKNVYYRIFIYATPFSTVPSNTTQKYGVEILNQDFEPLGYGRLPFDFNITWPRPLVTANGVLFQSTTSSEYNSGVVEYSLVEFVPTSKKNIDSLFVLNDLDSAFYEQGVNGYIKKLSEGKNAKWVLIFPYDATCPTCLNWFKDKILDNALNFEELDILLILQGFPDKEFDQYKEELLSVSKAIKVDTIDLIQKYSANDLFNPTLFEFHEADTMYHKVQTYNPHEKHLLLELFNKRSDD